jgi:hypothetical protein
MYPQQQMGWGGYGQGIPYNGSDPRNLKLKHSPGPGLKVGLGALVALLLSFFVLPWFSAGDESVSFTDMRDAFNADDGSDTASSSSSGVTDTTLPAGFDPSVTTLPPVDGGGGLGTPVTPPVINGDGEVSGDLPPVGTPVTPPPFDGSGDLGTTDPGSTSAASSDFNDHSDELEAFTDWGWLAVLYTATIVLLFTCWIVPSDRVLRFLTGTAVIPCLGWVNLVDRDGGSAPRVLGGIVAFHTVLLVVGNAWYLFWDNEGSPDPGIGAWLGILGSIALFVACVMGTKKEWVPAHQA